MDSFLWVLHLIHAIHSRLPVFNRINVPYSELSLASLLAEGPIGIHTLNRYYPAVDTSCDYYYKMTESIPVNSIMNDRISDLPDDILSQILLPLSLPDVVRSTILSRRWEKILLTLPHLDIDWRPMHGYPKYLLEEADCNLYVKNVDQILQGGLEDRNILSFRISCCLGLEYSSDVTRWLNIVASLKGLTSLTIQFEMGFDLMIGEVFHTISDSFLYQFPCLKKLDLEGCALKFQSDFRFTKLKSLNLCYVSLEGIQWESLASCPTIESLRFNNCKLPQILCLRNNLQYLKWLTICDCPSLRKIELNASNLNTFEIDCPEDVECSFLARPKLENLYVYYAGKPNEPVNILSWFVKDVSALKHLILRIEIHELKLATWPSDLFRSVLWLELDLCHDNPRGDIAKVLPHVLRCFPMLRKLELIVSVYDWHKYRDHEKSLYLTPYLHTNLREVALYNFKVSWIKFARFLLESATVLNKMMISKSYKYYKGYGIWSSCPKSFSTEERLCIQSALAEKALSPQANVIIENDYDNFNDDKGRVIQSTVVHSSK